MAMDEIQNEDIEGGDSNIMGTKDGMFVRQFLFDPVPRNFNTEDLMVILKLLNIAVAPNVFDQLPERTKRHFVEVNRKGERLRYGERRRRG